MSRRHFALPLLLCSTFAWAADPQPPAPVPPPPPMPQSGDVPVMKPDVTIRKEKDRTVEEYRINGQLYKVKITPKEGKPYFLLYPNGPAGPSVRREIGDLQIPSWVIFSW